MSEHEAEPVEVPEPGPEVGPDELAPDEEEDADDDESTLPPPQVSQPSSAAEMEKKSGQLEAEAVRHAKRVAAIMGDDFAMTVPCPLDFTPGFILDPSQVPIPDEVRTQVGFLFGIQSEPEYPEDAQAQTCPRCEGLGKLKTGSKVPEQETRPCPECNAQGWKQLAPDFTFTGQNVPAVGTSGMGNGTATVVPVQDAFGRPSGHPHYGQHPATVGV